MGDLNARIGNEQDFILDDDVAFVKCMDWYVVDHFKEKRRSKDLTVNTFGKSLLDMCCELNVHVLNGRCNGDKQGEMTYVSKVGSSVVDYIIVDTDIFCEVRSFTVLNIDVATHFPIVATLCVGAKHTQSIQMAASPNLMLSKQVVFHWKDDQRESFLSKMTDEQSLSQFQWFTETVNANINDSVLILIQIFHRAAENMKRCIGERKLRNQNTQPLWWDLECVQFKCVKNRLLNVFRATGRQEDLKAYLSAKTEFRKRCKFKRCRLKDELRDTLIANKNNVSTFWRIVKEMGRKSVPHPDIPVVEWVQYFERLLNQNVVIDESFARQVSQSREEHDRQCDECENNTVPWLNEHISADEIRKIIESMISGKAAGNDGINVEMLKTSKAIIVPYLELLFNRILDTGVYPQGWSEAILCPLHKQGPTNNVENYRGISLLSVISKVFTKILNQRFIKWAESNNKQHEEQAGYRKMYSTIDQIFNLYAITQKYLSKRKGRMYVLFVDFSKAFDSIPHALLWYKMIKSDVHGKVLNVLYSMYEQLKSCVRTPEGLSEYFDCEVGTRQGCMLSPFLFAFYIGELVDQMKAEGCQGIYVNEDAPNIFMLMYADDIATCADSVHRLQYMIDRLVVYCKKWGLRVNLLTTKIMVFRRGGIVKNVEKCFFSWHAY